MSGKFSLDDYIDVAERIQHFNEKHPDGSLQTVDWSVVEVAGKTFVVYQAAAFRSPDDPRPGHGIAWEPFPGPTPYTKDSELMNAETAAWGRAIVAVGLAANRKIASRQEVRARQGSQEARQPVPPPLLSEDAAEAVSAAVRAAGMPQEWLRMTLIDAGVQNVPEGPITPATIRALTPEQAEKLVTACGDVVNARELRRPKRVVTTPLNDPIVQACIDNGGHFWDQQEPPTCTRCWFNPGWVKGRPRDGESVRPIRDEPQA